MATSTETVKYLNILLFKQEHVDERRNKESVWYFPLHYKVDAGNGKPDASPPVPPSMGKDYLEDNFKDSLEVLQSTLPLNVLLGRTWDGVKSDVDFISLDGEVYQSGYSLNDGKQITAAFWDYYATPELLAQPKRFSSFRSWFVEKVTAWLVANRLEYVHDSDQDEVYFEKFRVTIPVSGAVVSETGDVADSTTETGEGTVVK